MKLIRFFSYFIFFISSLSSEASKPIFSGQLKKQLTRSYQGQKLTGECLSFETNKLPQICKWYDQKQRPVLEEHFTESLTQWKEQILLLKNGKPVFEKTTYLSPQESLFEELVFLGKHQLIKIQTLQNQKIVKTKYFQLTSQEQRPLMSCNEDQMKKWFQQMDIVQFMGSKDKDGYSTTHFGLRIHQSCIESRKGSQKIINETASALLTGLSCLKKLNTPQAQDHRARIEMLFRGQPKPKLFCGQQKYDWQSANAFATVNSVSDPEHPKISLNPYTCGHWHPDDFKSTFFHELFHNIGYIHGKDPEYAYTCSQCCFDDDPATKVACELCAEIPQNIKDPVYLQKLIQIYNTNFKVYRPHELVIESLTEKPQDEKHHQLRLQLGANMVSYHLGQAYLDQMPTSIKKKMDPQLVEKIKINVDQEAFQTLSPQAQKIAQAEYLLQRKDEAQAEKILLQLNYPERIPKTIKNNMQKLVFAQALKETQLLHRDLLAHLANSAMNKNQHARALQIYDQMDKLR